MEKKFNRFILSVYFAQENDGKWDCNSNSYNEGVPNELLIMKLRSILKQLEDTYFNNTQK